MPAPARAMSFRGGLEFFSRPRPSRLLDLGPEGAAAHELVMKAEDRGRDLGGAVKVETEKVDDLFASVASARELNPLINKIDQVPGTNIGVHRIVRLVEDPQALSSEPLTALGKKLVGLLRDVNTATGRIAELGRQSTITRTPIDVGDFATEMGAGRIKVGSDAELALARKHSMGNEGVVTEHGLLSRRSDGHYHPWETQQGEVFVRLMTPEFTAMLMHGREGKALQEIIKAMAAHPRNAAKGLTEDRLWEWADAKREQYNRPGALSPDGSGSIAVESFREIPFMPTAYKNGKVWVDLMDVKPTSYASRLRTGHAGHIGFAEVFGQGINETYIDRNTMELVQVKSEDTYTPMARNITNRYGARAGELMGEIQRSMNGLPITKSLLEPLTPMWHAYNAFKTGSTALRSLMLTASPLLNIPETFLGSTAAMFGPGQVVRAIGRITGATKGNLTRDQLVKYLDQGDAISRFTMDYSFNKNHPIRESVRVGSAVLGRVTGMTQINELQESIGPVVAMQKLEDWRVGKVEKTDRAVLESMEVFTKKEVDALLSGLSRSEVDEKFMRHIAQITTGSPLSRVMKSAAGDREWFKDLFPFLSYGMSKMDTFGASMRGVNRAYESLKGSGSDPVGAAMGAMKTPAAALLGREIGYTTAQGASGALLLALAFGGSTGLSIALNEAEDQPGKFMTEAFLFSAVTGPYGQALRYITNPSDPPSMAIAKSTFPGAMLDEAHAMFTGQGSYKNMTPFERSVEFFRRKTPATGPVSTILAVVGLSDRDAALEGSLRAYWKWRFAEAKPGKASPAEASKEDTRFRQSIRRAMDAIRKNQDPTKHIEEALAVDGKDARAAQSAILVRRVLHPLTAEQQESLRQRIGDKGFAKLQDYDEMLEMWADRVA